METENVTLLVAFSAGILSFLSPCCLPLVPAYVSHLAGTTMHGQDLRPSAGRTFVHALAFVIGFAIVFTAWGASFGLIGYVLNDKMPILRKLGGIVLVVFGLQTAGILQIPWLYREKQLNIRADQRLGYLSSVLVGMVFALGWTPCIGFVLSAILLLASTSQTVSRGALLLFVYSIGLGLPFLATGMAMGRMSGIWRKFRAHARAVSLVSGVFLVVTGIAIYLNLMTRLVALLWFLPNFAQ